jgi:hypothetical protein
MLVKTSCLAVALTACLCISQGAVAEEKKAVCEFHNHGDLKKDKTGPCGWYWQVNVLGQHKSAT